MNKKQFLYTLSQGLAQLGPVSVNEILADFDEHFRNGILAGQSEDQIAEELGNPSEIARQYILESPDDLAAVRPTAAVAAAAASQTSYVRADSPAAAQPAGQVNDGALVLVILLNLFIGIPIWIALFAVLSGFWAAAAGIGVTACVLFAVAILETGITSLILVLFGLAQTALTVLSIILMVFMTKWLINGLRAYVRWNRKLIHGGAFA